MISRAETKGSEMKSRARPRVGFALVLLSLFTVSALADTTDRIKARCVSLLSTHKSKTPSELKPKDLQVILGQASDNIVTDLGNVGKYDPTGAIGFCFGRAYATQIYAELAGVPKERIRKIFVIGDMRSGGMQSQEWRFHVTTVVQGADNRWYALDPIAPGGRIQTAAEWIQFVRKGWDRWHGGKPRTKFYFVDADGMLPDVRNYPEGIVGIESDGAEYVFNPSAQGLAADPAIRSEFKDDQVWNLTSDQTRRYFLHLGEGETRFDFTQLTILGEKYDYHGYFEDFVESMFKERDPRAAPRVRARGPRAALISIPLGLSPLFLIHKPRGSEPRNE